MVSCLLSVTMPYRDRKGQTRREAGAQSLRTSEGGGRVAEPTRARPKWEPARRVGAQRGLEKRPRGHATVAWYGPKRGSGEARTPPAGGAGDVGAPGAAKGPFGKGEDASWRAQDASVVDRPGSVAARTHAEGWHPRAAMPTALRLPARARLARWPQLVPPWTTAREVPSPCAPLWVPSKGGGPVRARSPGCP
jgi:hypothetical protein